MTDICKHGRKDWKCTYCKGEAMQEEARQIKARRAKQQVALSYVEEKDFGKIPDITDAMDFKDLEKKVVDSLTEATGLAAKELTRRHPNITEHHGTRTGRFRKRLGEIGNHDLGKKMMDTEFLMSMMKSYGVEVKDTQEATRIVDSFLGDMFGLRCKLDEAPWVDRKREWIEFPTCLGRKLISFSQFIDYLMNLGREFSRPSHDAIRNVTVTFKPGRLDEVKIKGPCEIVFNGKKLRAVREGDKLHLIDTDDYRKLI